MQTEKIAGRFDCKVYNPKLPKEQWKLAADDGNVVLTVTYPLAKLPDMFKVNGQVDEFCKFYASRDEQRAAKEANRQPVADRIAVKFKVCSNCKWFDATGTKMARPTNEALDGKPVMVMVDFARKAKDATKTIRCVPTPPVLTRNSPMTSSPISGTPTRSGASSGSRTASSWAK